MAAQLTFLVKVYQNGTDSIFASFGLGNGHVGVDCVAGRIGWKISIGKAHGHGRGRITHKFRAAGHEGDHVHVRMRPTKQFIFSFL